MFGQRVQFWQNCFWASLSSQVIFNANNFLISINLGDSGVDQLVEIIKVLGTPTREEINKMNPNYTTFRFPLIRPHPWQRGNF
jgi:hypothetical protein